MIKRGNNGHQHPTVPTTTYNLMIPTAHYRVLSQLAHDRSRHSGYTSVAELIREAIADYVEKQS